MATSDTEGKAVPGTGSEAAGPRQRRDNDRRRSQNAPEINLILADPRRVRITRRTQMPAEKPGGVRQGQPALIFITAPVERLRSCRFRCLTPYRETAVRALARSIRATGWQLPILVRPHPAIARHYEVVVGDLPFRAAKLAGLASLPVAVCGLTDLRALECVLLEDARRPDLAPFEIAVCYGQLIGRFNYGLAELARLVGQSERQVARLLLLLGSSAAASAASRDALAGVASGAGALEPPSLAADLAALARHLSGLLGLKVEMAAHGRRGVVRISFEDIKELERLARHLSSFDRRADRRGKPPGLAA